MRIPHPGRARTARRMGGSVAVLGLAASLPSGADGAAHQGRTSTLSLVFDGVQRAGAGR